MTTIAISALPVAVSQASADVLPIVQATTSTTKQLSIGNLFTNSALVTPTLGTPVSGTLTTCTGLPISTGVSGLATGIATFLGAPSSSNLRGALTDETGTGFAVFATSPTLITPILGAATATSIVSGLVATTAAAPTIASATTIAPTASITIISGTAAIVTITAPTPISAGGGTITFIPTGAFTTTNAGNIAIASTAVVGRAITFTYDVTTVKWYPSY